MEINIQTPHFTPRADLLDFVKEKVNKLVHFDTSIVKADVYLKLENTDRGDNKIAEIRLFIPGHDLFASHTCPTFEEATVKAADALEKQIKHRKEKIQG